MNKPALIAIPESLQSMKLHGINAFSEALADKGLDSKIYQQWPAEKQQQLARVLTCSEFVVEQVRRCPEILLELLESGELDRSVSRQEIIEQLAKVVDACSTEDELLSCLRKARNRQQIRIIWRDITRQADLIETCKNLSDFADASIDQAYHWLYKEQAKVFGVPIGRYTKQPQHLVILGMGKLGAQELNLSSDIDLIFAYPEGGETEGAKKSLDNQEFFTRLGQKLIKALDSITIDGFVFRVDMRLRPYGSSGPLVYSFPAMEQYYQDQGRDWERYAMIKARVVAGDKETGKDLIEILRPFVYRRYLDFTAIEALRTMKQLIQQEVKRKGMSENIKLGSGGIREIEFIAQAFQLIHGGRDLSLQQRPLLKVLDTLAGEGYLPSAVVDELKSVNCFLRYVEHAIQTIADKQTQMLPDNPTDQARVAFMMGYENWQAFYEALTSYRERIDWHFKQVIADPEEEEQEASQAVGEEWLSLWIRTQDEENSCNQLAEAGFTDVQALYQKLMDLRHSPSLRSIQRTGKERLDAFVPRLINAAMELEQPTLSILRVLPLIEAVARRSVYLVLLTENPSALKRLLKLCAASPWIAEQITHYPVLLDELLNEDKLFSPPKAVELAAELRQHLARIPEDDLEQQMEALRHFKLAHRLRVAASEITGNLPLMKVSDYLTWLAEAILTEVLHLAWRQCVSKYGVPQRLDGTACDLDYIIIGYGKVGGIEMGHNSDLDLVFIHNGDPQSETDGAKSIDGLLFFTRLGQRIIHILTTQTTSGILYEVDMRLRPSGASGLLVSSLAAFQRYQEKEAWTWEHQALVRARVLTGASDVAEAFEKIRIEILGRQRDLTQLQTEVSEMRKKMRDNLGTQITNAGLGNNAFAADQLFNLKHDAGGMVDIEFMTQFVTLAWSWKYPELSVYTDNIRILDAMAETHLMTQEDALWLQDTYRAYRSVVHKLALQNEPNLVAANQFVEERKRVMSFWYSLGLS
ncbi:bifunctional [glutamate--ammonia ligase]-adenylyl-L-tyrosine phosphorylase/[glutamate--ammonia-ligase] adenylyltransferase [Entomomonas asaccharolytica]|uniref:Bifunctional glutamine synthetase adenylyltransferase/adenylyl-removing enzyme n=1 Tax=Entomomonas asaccharolytica TaxID=2785331 RepID=A0A974RX18_9GAMM|nr:bifunctional [glutamate--ammonia ligase]-adenylyl-L-tyrosine phosphorylase/[glutamate--ammonia-ligase] adenylyltransferase [Entomomonas asaccharolytica]QQP85758.1 bifunctional [glutamate--ammonia ligase]-adenylyl-L-tyrosine phosphorylase/[glutamate--ammonia-ligase] adenylyltransferase [Entomomonas asaccharolytica]